MIKTATVQTAQAKTAETKSDLIICAIAGQQLLTCRYDNRTRIVEPHTLGYLHGKLTVLTYQLCPPTGPPDRRWRLLRIAQIRDLAMLPDTFPGPRPTTGPRTPWEYILATVN